MNAQALQQQWFDRVLQENPVLAAAPDSDWIWQQRLLAGERMRSLPLPTRKQESWRYTWLDGLYAHSYYNQQIPVTGLDRDDIDSWVYPESESYRLVFANGLCVPELSNIATLPDSIRIGSLRAMSSTDPGLVSRVLAQRTAYEEDVFATLNRAYLNDGLLIEVADGIELSWPIEVVYLNLSFERNTLSQPHSVVVLGEGARIKLVERFISTGESCYFFNGVSDIHLGPHSAMQHVRVQNESGTAYHLGRVGVSQAAASEYRALHVAAGGAWNRTDIAVRFSGERADCQLSGVYTAGPRQYSDFHLDVRHAAPACRSREDFRGIVHAGGHAVFDGRVLVEAGAQQTDAMLNNRSLLLGEDAEVDSKPQLEIYADDVKCGHGSTVAGIDPQQLYYMQSRGVPLARAQRLLSQGFVQQPLAQLDDLDLRGFISELLSERLAVWEQAI